MRYLAAHGTGHRIPGGLPAARGPARARRAQAPRAHPAAAGRRLGTSQSAINRIEQGNQNLSLEMLSRIAARWTPRSCRWATPGPCTCASPAAGRCPGSIAVKSCKNAAVALLCASLLNRGRTVLRKVARIEEVNRILEVLDQHRRAARAGSTPTATSSSSAARRARPAGIDVEAARRTRSIIMFLGPLLHAHASFELPYAGGCDLGTRTVEPHMTALRPFGLDGEGHRRATTTRRSTARSAPQRPIVLTERGDTVTENALLAAARHDGRDRDPQRQPQLHGPGPVLLPDGARRARSTASARRRWWCAACRHQRRRRLRAVRGPDRGDEPAHGRHRHRRRS